MRRDHVGFFIFLTYLLIAPDVSLGGFAGLPGRSDVSLGIAGLVVWVVLSPKRLVRCKRYFHHTPAYGAVMFALYSLVVSIISQSLASTLYAAQYFLYAFVGFQMVSGYLWDAAKCGEAVITSKIIMAIGLTLTIGTIVSSLTGPIYPHQAFWTRRNVDSRWVQRGVGFSGNPNATAAVLLVLVPLCLSFVPRTAVVWRSCGTETVMLPSSVSSSLSRRPLR